MSMTIFIPLVIVGVLIILARAGIKGVRKKN